MITLNAFGLTMEHNDSQPTLSCPPKDIRNIYHTFKEVFSERFDDSRSSCYLDVDRVDLNSILETSIKSSNKDDIYFFYFSGHGEIDSDELYLILDDYEIITKRGRISTSELRAYFDRFKGDVVVVLDCCHSGAGLDLSRRKTIYKDAKISIITSSSACNVTKCEPEGSVFTKIFCDSIIDLHDEDKDVSLVNIMSPISSNKELDCMMNIKDGFVDITLCDREDIFSNDPFYKTRFFKSVDSSNIEEKVVLWYQLIGLQDKYKKEILQKWQREIGQHGEASWQVRRAIGKVIESLSYRSQYKVDLVLDLLKSDNWMHVCTGIMGAKSLIHNPEVVEEIEGIIQSCDHDSHDPIWLGNLIYSDTKAYDYKLSLKSKLADTPWGLIDIWKRSQGFNGKSPSIDEFISQVRNQELLTPLFTHLYFDKSYQKLIKSNGKFDEEIVSDRLAKKLYGMPQRGKPENKKVSLLYSLLYGNWRDNIILDLDGPILGKGPERVKTSLKLAAKLPAVELRMAIFDYMAHSKAAFDMYSNEILWGFNDPHPWVRRSAIKAFKWNLDIPRSFQYDNIDHKLYPGYFDLLIEAHYNNIPVLSDLEKLPFSYSEKQALVEATKAALIK